MKLNNFTNYADNTHSTRDHMTDNVTSNFGLSKSGCFPCMCSLIEIQEDLREFETVFDVNKTRDAFNFSQ